MLRKVSGEKNNNKKKKSYIKKKRKVLLFCFVFNYQSSFSLFIKIIAVLRHGKLYGVICYL